MEPNQQQFKINDDQMRQFKNHLQDCYQLLDKQQNHLKNIHQYDRDFTYFISKRIKFNLKLQSKLVLKYVQIEEDNHQQCSTTSDEVQQLDEHYQERKKQTEDKYQKYKGKLEGSISTIQNKLDKFIDQINNQRQQQIKQFEDKSIDMKLNSVDQKDSHNEAANSSKLVNKLLGYKNKIEQIDYMICKQQQDIDYQIEQQDKLVQQMLQMDQELEQYT